MEWQKSTPINSDLNMCNILTMTVMRQSTITIILNMLDEVLEWNMAAMKICKETPYITTKLILPICSKRPELRLHQNYTRIIFKNNASTVIYCINII